MSKIQCCATTSKRLPCPFHADRMWDNKHYCHIHDPMGTFQQQHRGSPGSFANLPREVRELVLDLVRIDRESETYGRLVKSAEKTTRDKSFAYLSELYESLAQDLA